MDKFLKKTTARTKERLLEGIGKAKATQDEVFDQHAANLSKQAKTGERLQKDIKSYCSALKALCQAERQLRDTIRDTYEAEWPEREHLTALMDNLDIQTNELERAMGEDLVHTASNYVGQFGDLKKKTEKRGRKLIDYDHAKNTYNSLKNSSKKVDSDPKVAKALTELQNAEFCYKEINSELVEILPATYDSRITFVVDTLQHMFNAQSVYNNECSKLNKQVVGQLDKLGQSIDHLRVPRLEPRTLTPIDTNPGQEDDRVSTPSPALAAGAGSARNSVVSANLAPTPAAPVNPPQKVPSANSVNPFDEDESTVPEEEEVCQNKVYPKLNAEKDDTKDVSNPFDDSEDESAPPKVIVKAEEVKEEKTVVVREEVKEEKKAEVKKILYTVQTTHEYKAVDSDELSFGPGEEIKVLEAPDTAELDEGWRFGEKADGTKGVFPENFTKKK